MSDKNWWRGAVIYQIYPRSFMDASGDGVGDLAGITQKLDYVASLGVDGIWLSPFFTSPMKDFGYDVSDYRGVDPLFGTIGDFEALLDKAHRLGLKIIIDQVLSHSSDLHPWFRESRENRTNGKADWYVWAAPRPDGTPPTNWQSVFGGPAWTYDVRRGQYYLHNFLSTQPDLNLQNPVVQDAILAEAEFWLKLGVDGFRLDTANYYLHDAELRDNPPGVVKNPENFNIDFPSPYTMQMHLYDKNRPENIGFIRKIRVLLDRYGAMAVGEIGDDEHGMSLAAEYTAGETGLQTAYNFSLLGGAAPSPLRIENALGEYLRQPVRGWPSWAMSNHDVTRVASRWNAGDKFGHDPRMSRTAFALLCCLQGTIFTYQGEELGLPEARIPFEKLQDPFGKYTWPRWQGRDGCRTPMPWTAGEHAGFTAAAEPWLPVPDSHLPLSVAGQEKDPHSTLAFTRAFIKWRKNQPALVSGEIEFMAESDTSICAFTRRAPGQDLLCVFNLSDEDKTYKPAMAVKGATPYGRLDGATARLGPWEIFIGEI